jgi:phospholipid/cholesterol/gamma-HCH transport system substrate-binding protein
VLGALLAAAAVALAVAIVLGNPGGRNWSAEFTSARGLVPGNDVRDDGAVVGRVTAIQLTRDGTALVRFQLSDQRAAPRGDATAAIEPADLLGDTYMSLSPGSGRGLLRGPIDRSRTVNAPRLDQLLSAFSPQVRDGLQALLLETGLALDGRGGSLARATVALRPALRAAGGVLGELDSQNGSLARLVPVAQQAVAGVDSHRADIGPLLDGLARTLQATAGSAGALDSTLSGLPALLSRLRRTATGLAATAASATPLSQRLEPLTGTLAQTASGLPGFVEQAKRAAPAFEAALRSASTALATATPGLSELRSAFPTLRSQAPAISTLMAELDSAAPGIAQGFFVDFPDQAAESGQQPLDPFADPRRAYWRGAAVFSCEAFGVPVAPGCLTKALGNLTATPAPSRTASLLRYLLAP